MDNLTHSLIGAVLGQAGLKRKTGLAMPTLIIAANLPDIDATCTFLGTVSLAMRRGLTHGPLAMIVLPVLLTGAMIVFDRWQWRRGKRPAGRLPIRPGWLLALAYIGCLSHPLFDWMNSYGVRLLEPFSHRWFYGDALFIVDPWLLVMLGAGIWFSLRGERKRAPGWSRPAHCAIAAVACYVAVNIGITALAVDRIRMEAPYPEVAVANPVPLAFWRREVLWRGEGRYGSYAVSPFGSRKELEPARPTGMDDPRIAARLPHSAAAQAYLFWSRMPVAEVRGDTITLRDQRIMRSIRGWGFSVELKP